MKLNVNTAALVALFAASTATQHASGKNMDVLMIAVDDLRPQIDCVDLPGAVRPKMHTPNICKLAKDSLVLERSQVAMATCSPSRTALLTGRHTSTTHVWDLFSYFRNVSSAGNWSTIPGYFKDVHGYRSWGMGKIFHPGFASGQVAKNCPICIGADDGAYSWSEPYFHGKDPVDTDNSRSWLAYEREAESPLCDTQTKNHALSVLRNISKARAEGDGEEENFFVAVGFHKPHLPFVFPKDFLDFYPNDEIQLPPNQFAPDEMPTIAWQSYGETRSYHDVGALNASGAINTTLPAWKVKQLRRAYYAAVSYTDSNIGAVLDELENLGLADTTLVVFWGDHGWQLGEHGEWDKHTNFDLATHAPVMYRVPGLTEGGITTRMPTETVDIFPSLVDFATGGAAEIPTCPPDSRKIKTCTEGTSVRPLITNPQIAIKGASFSMYNRGIPHKVFEEDQRLGKHTTPSGCLTHQCAMGYTMLTLVDGHEVRYTEWVKFGGPNADFSPDWSVSYGVELYNHTADPSENVNVHRYADPEVTKALSDKLRKNWQGNF